MVFLIAELGVNWDGDFDLAKKMMSNAKTLGFNAVKFQAFNEDTLGNHTHLDRLMKSAITEKNVQRIDEIPNEMLFDKTAQLCVEWNKNNNVGIVVGATAPKEISRIRNE